MNKSELINALADKTQLSKKNAEKALNAFVEVVTDAMKAGDKVQLVGFGTFESKDRPARTARNPRTGESVKIPASKAVSFKVGNTNYNGSSTFYRPNRENAYLHSESGPSSWDRQRKQTKLKYPSTYVTVGEVGPTGAFIFAWYVETPIPAGTNTNQYIGLANHDKSSVYLRADGHADVMSIPESLRGKNQYKKEFYPNGESSVKEME